MKTTHEKLLEKDQFMFKVKKLLDFTKITEGYFDEEVINNNGIYSLEKEIEGWGKDEVT